MTYKRVPLQFHIKTRTLHFFIATTILYFILLVLCLYLIVLVKETTQRQVLLSRIALQTL